MGNDGPDAVPDDGEGPVRRVSVDAFSIATTTVTNREFGDFGRATRCVTDAERAGASFVFYLQLPAERRRGAGASHLCRLGASLSPPARHAKFASH